MKAVFADAGYWIALFSSQDQLHHKAVAVSATIGKRQIVTSQMVLTELLDAYAGLGPYFRQQAVVAVGILENDANVVIVPQTDAQLHDALTFYVQRKDKDWSLTNCTSFLTMQEYGISEALAYDKHFVQAGFIALLRDS